MSFVIEPPGKCNETEALKDKLAIFRQHFDEIRGRQKTDAPSPSRYEWTLGVFDCDDPITVTFSRLTVFECQVAEKVPNQIS